jgi:DNA primase
MVNPEDDVPATVQVPHGFILLATVFENVRDPDVRDTISYARSRGLRLRDFWKFKLGTCTAGRYRRRLIIPSFNISGELNYFVARSIDDVKMKYLNAKIPKTDIIFNEINIDWSEELTLVEGPMDLIKCGDNTACLLGSHFSEEYNLFQEIVRHSTPVLLALDSDAMKKSQRFAKLLASYGNAVRMLDLGNYSDVGEMSHEEFARAKENAREWTPNERLYHLINSINSGSVI